MKPRIPVLLTLLAVLNSSVATRHAGATERSLSLAEALSLARERDSKVWQATADIQSAKVQVLTQQLARVDFKIYGSGSALFQTSSQQPAGTCATTPSACSALNLGLTSSLKVPLWTGLALEASLAQAHWRERSAEAARLSVFRNLVVNVAQAYWEVRRKELTYEAVSETARHFRQLELLTQQQVRAGIAPAADYNRSRAATLNVEAQLVAMRTDVESAHAQLASVLQVDDDLRLTDDPTKNTAVLPPLDEAIREALANRPELAQVRSDYEAAVQGLRVAKGAYWPQIAVVAQSQLTGSAPANAAPTGGLPGMPATSTQPLTTGGANASTMAQASAASSSQLTFYGGVQVDWNIFDMLTTWLKVREAGFTRERAQAEVGRRRYDVLTDLRTAHAQLKGAILSQEPTNKVLALARIDLELVRKRYSLGTGQLIDVLDVQDKLLQAELQAINRAVDLTEADVKLKAAMGRF
jgi:outer membrane protein TolC